MEYPGSKFTHRIRLATLLIFIAAFFLISPIVLIYSAGYRFDFKNGLLLETGSLSVDILPKDAAVYLDGLKIDQRMPIRLNNITPHKYTLKISATGYYDWEKQIEINKNKTTYIKEFFLLKKSKPKLLSNDISSDLALSSSGRYLAYTSKKGEKTKLVIANEERQAPTLTFQMSGTLLLSWAPQVNYLAVMSNNGGRKRLSVINAETGKITEVYNADPILKYIWSDNSASNLYYGTKKGIYSFAPDLGVSSLITSAKFLDWYMADGTLWTMDVNTSTGELEIWKDALGFKSLFSSFSAIRDASTSTLSAAEFKTIQRNTILLKDQATNHFYIIRSSENFVVDANKYFFSKFNSWWLFWGQYELWSYSEGDEPTLLSRSGEKFENVLSLDQFNTLALLRAGEISALFPYFYLDRTMVDDSVKSMTNNPNSRTLYFSDNKGIWKLDY